eukprot:PhF_6_TR24749/c0_g1_i1/m.33924
MTGNIKVVVRVRPSLAIDPDPGGCIHISSSTSITCDPESDNPKKHKSTNYTFDAVYGPEATNEDVYRGVGMNVLKLIRNGRNVCVYAYGQTMSGKTYTMLGEEDANEDGLIQRVLGNLFKSFREEEQRQVGYTFGVAVSFCEIYNEKIVDLLKAQTSPLSPSASYVNLSSMKSFRHDVTSSMSLASTCTSEKDLRVLRDKERGPYVENLTTSHCTCIEEVVDILEQGQHARRTAKTKSNDQSSRSHAIFRVNITSFDVSSALQQTMNATMYFVDLAGTESYKVANTQEQVQEGKHIRLSLLTLHRVIDTLAQPLRSRGTVPYRESNLTWLLRHTLGGDYETCFIANVSPARAYLHETNCTLDCMKKAKCIVNLGGTGVDTKRMIINLGAEIRALKQELFPESVKPSLNRTTAATTKQASAILEETIRRLEQRMEETEHGMRQLQSERDYYRDRYRQMVARYFMLACRHTTLENSVVRLEDDLCAYEPRRSRVLQKPGVISLCEKTTQSLSRRIEASMQKLQVVRTKLNSE